MKFSFYARRIPPADQEGLGELYVKHKQEWGKEFNFFKVKTLITFLCYSDYLVTLSVQQGKILPTKEPI